MIVVFVVLEKKLVTGIGVFSGTHLTVSVSAW